MAEASPESTLSRANKFIADMMKSIEGVDTGTKSKLMAVMEREQQKMENLLGGADENGAERNTIRLFGVPETPNRSENTKYIVIQYLRGFLRVSLRKSDILYCFRTGDYVENQRRVVIIKFATEEAHKRIWDGWRILASEKNSRKGEVLTPEMRRIWRKALGRYGKCHVSIVDGAIEVFTPAGNFERFNNLLQIRKYMRANPDPVDFYMNWMGSESP